MTQGILALVIILGSAAVCSIGGFISTRLDGYFFDGFMYTLLGGALAFLIVIAVCAIVITWKVPL